MSTVALVPAHRRADRVGATVTALIPLVDRVVVIDDGSSDGGATARAASSAGATVVALPSNRGKGGALTAGVDATPDATRYLLVDADLAATAGGVEPLLAALDGGADLAVGVLPPAGGRGGFGLVRDAAGVLIRRASGRVVEAPLSGQRAVRAELLRSLLPLADRFGVEAAMTVDAVRSGGCMVEVAVDVEHRHTGRTLAGAVHRARQGWDLLRAMWPRLLRPPARAGVIAAVALAGLVLAHVTASSVRPVGTAVGAARRVLLVAGPVGLALDEVHRSDLPQLGALAGSAGAFGAAQVASARRDPRSLWATVGAGERVAVPDAPDPPSPPERPFAVGSRVEGAGRLGAAVRRSGRATAFVGPSSSSPLRWAVADDAGQVDRGATAAATGASGLAARALADLQSSALVAVDGSQLDAPGFDDLLRRLRPALDGTSLLVLLVPPPRDGHLPLAPVVVSGPGMAAGSLTSPSTRREGLVLAADLAPTILSALGLPVPAGMTGRAVRRIAGSPDTGGLAALDRRSQQRSALWDPSILPLVLLQIGLYATAIWRRPQRQPRRDLLALGSLGVAAWPLATWVARALPFTDRSLPAALGAALLVDAGAVAAGWRLGRGRGLAPLALVLSVTLVLVGLDLAVGAPLQLSSAFGYAATTAGRFTGLGNGGFAVVATAAAVLVACAPRRAPWVAVLLAVTTIAVGDPALGGDVGGLLTLAPVSVLTVAALWGRLRWRTAFGATAAGVLAVLALGILDLQRAADERTHLGRFLAGGRWDDVLAHRLAVNARGYLVVPVLAPLVLIALWMLWSLFRGRWVRLLPFGSPARVGVTAAIAIALLGHAVNDSGPVIVGIACITIGPFLVLRALAVEDAAEGPPVLAPGTA